MVKSKIMPVSPEVNLEEIKTKAKEIVESKGGKNVMFEEEPVAFGLKAVIVMMALDEDTGDSEGINEALEKIENVNSSQIIDMRRAFG